MINPNQKFYTLDEIEQMLGLSRWQLLRLLKGGKLRGIRVSQKAWRIPEDNLKDFLSNSRQ